MVGESFRTVYSLAQILMVDIFSEKNSKGYPLWKKLQKQLFLSDFAEIHTQSVVLVVTHFLFSMLYSLTSGIQVAAPKRGSYKKKMERKKNLSDLPETHRQRVVLLVLQFLFSMLYHRTSGFRIRGQSRGLGSILKGFTARCPRNENLHSLQTLMAWCCTI